MSYTDYPIKCMACGLHYTVHSWNEDWHQTDDGKTRSATNGGVCPECGAIGAKVIFEPVPQGGQIFEIVGNTAAVEITPAVAQGLGHGAATLRPYDQEEEGA